MALDQGKNEDQSALTPTPEIPDPLHEAVLAQQAEAVKRARDGDQNALITLYENHVERVYHYIYNRVGNSTEAEDLTSETFIRALEALMSGNYVWQGKPISAWLFGIAYNVLRERKRRLSHLPHIENVDSLLESAEPIAQEADIPDKLIRKEEQTALWDLVKKLPIAEQQVLVMRHVYNLPYSEIARRIKRGEHASKQLHYRALTKLKHMIQGDDR